METNVTLTECLVFVADDHASDKLLLKEAFAKVFPFAPLKFFSNGMELIVELEKKLVLLPRFIIMEFKMPLMCGIQTLKWLRKNKKCKNIPVIIFSSGADSKDINLCYQLGANSYLVKPSDLPHYYNLVKGLKRFFLK